MICQQILDQMQMKDGPGQNELVMKAINTLLIGPF